jgi:hypothetical protein
MTSKAYDRLLHPAFAPRKRLIRLRSVSGAKFLSFAPRAFGMEALLFYRGFIAWIVDKDTGRFVSGAAATRASTKAQHST